MRALLVLLCMSLATHAQGNELTWKPHVSVIPDSILLKEAVGRMRPYCESFVKEEPARKECAYRAAYLYGVATFIDVKLFRLSNARIIKMRPEEIISLHRSIANDVERFEEGAKSFQKKFPLVWQTAPFVRTRI